MAKGPQRGDPAPDFELEGTAGAFRLSEQRGSNVVLLFYPGDETSVCTRQFCSYRDRADDLASLDATIVGISPQDVDSHNSFTANHDLNVPLLADPGRGVAKAYGVSRPGHTARATFVIGADGVVGYRHVHALGLSYQSVDDLREALSSVAAPA